ncbi:MAG: hypothetical protein ACREFE_10455 [Limisphaerales bacterium]
MPLKLKKIDISPARRKYWLKKIVAFLAITVLFGWFYGWATVRFFPANTKVGFGYGIVHGALMPLSLPSLLMGKDVTIYAADNSGRSYKLGYIVGIDVCGLVFFGPLFWRPKQKIKIMDEHE